MTTPSTADQQIMELINMLMLDAGTNEIGVTDKEWMDMIDEIYQMYRDISGVPKIGFSFIEDH